MIRPGRRHPPPWSPLTRDDILIGITSAPFIVTTFAFGLPPILAVIINCMNQNDARGTFLESHFRGQIRSFWFANWDRRRSDRMRPEPGRREFPQYRSLTVHGCQLRFIRAYVD
jgi:hypothetical protein